MRTDWNSCLEWAESVANNTASTIPKPSNYEQAIADAFWLIEQLEDAMSDEEVIGMINYFFYADERKKR